MKAISIFILGLALSVPVSAQTKVTNFRLKNLDNRTVSFNSLQGEALTVIDFWATWCKPCEKSLPELAKLSDEFQNKGVNFVGISIDSPRNLAKVKPFARSHKIAYPVLLDTNSEIMAKLSVRAVPTLLIVNDENEIVYFHEGYQPGEENQIRDEIVKQLQN